MEQKTKNTRKQDILKSTDKETVDTGVHFTAHSLIDTAIKEEVEKLATATTGWLSKEEDVAETTKSPAVIKEIVVQRDSRGNTKSYAIIDELGYTNKGSSDLEVGIYLVSNTAQVPEFATDGSACFDLRADFTNYETIKVYNSQNEVLARSVSSFPQTKGDKGIRLGPKERALIPTNIIFDIPLGYSLKLSPRSGLALKEGLNLINCVGVVDHDYIDPVFIALFNNTDVTLYITDQERLCQGEFIKSPQNKFVKLDKKPELKTNRIGGFGSTNKK